MGASSLDLCHLSQPWDIPAFQIPESMEEWEDLVAGSLEQQNADQNQPEESCRVGSSALNNSQYHTRSNALHKIHFAGNLQPWPGFLNAVQGCHEDHTWQQRTLGYTLQAWDPYRHGRFADFKCIPSTYSGTPDVIVKDSNHALKIVGELKAPWIIEHRIRLDDDQHFRAENVHDQSERCEGLVELNLSTRLTGLVTGLPIEWVLNRASFTPMFGKGDYNTFTDGVLRISKTQARTSRNCA
ncbi:hypothetical protein CNMCM6106_004459 [Aspergillus hiratsukae]|uniref:Uncharacterized protein n=1 Tax=Aspergillus hiratsukae TaxID=1194566 RepID=A0A8H6QBR2_9EURO|nr:hypothetical protein CNMCM6106_004459 [Aspergillus hiratsukae]